jgi:hypothetical protein
VIDGHLLTDKPEEWRVEARGGFKVPAEMEFLNGIFSRDFGAYKLASGFLPSFFHSSKCYS